MEKTENYTRDQLNQIRLGKEHHVDVTLFSSPRYYAVQMQQIRLGLEHGIDVRCYADLKYDWFQMEEIRLGLEDGLDVNLYMDPEIPYDVMRQIRKGLKYDIHLEEYRSLDVDMLRELRYAIRDHRNMMPYIRAGYGAKQLHEIREALNHNCV